MEWNSNSNIANQSNMNFTVIGYGKIDVQGQQATTLKVLSVSTYSHEYYKKQNYFYNKNNFLCADDQLINGQSTYLGDSVGPLFIPQSSSSNNNDIIVGIVSYGRTFCPFANNPTFYTRVSSYNDWIQSFVCQYSSIKPNYCNELIQHEINNKYVCPLYMQCSQEKYVMHYKTILGVSLQRCTSGGFMLRTFKTLGWECGVCPYIKK